MRMNSILTQRKAPLPSDVVTGSEVVSGLATEQVVACQQRFLVGSIGGGGGDSIQHSGWDRVCLTILSWVQLQANLNFWSAWWVISPQRLETSTTDISVAVHLEARSSSTAFLVLWWWSCYTGFWHYWWPLSELSQCRGSRPAASTEDGWQKLRCFQKLRGMLLW